MNEGDLNKKLAELKEIISKEVFITKDKEKITSHAGMESNWLFDFRKIILNPNHLNLIADIFFDVFRDAYPFRGGGLETAAIPLISAVVMKSRELGMPVNGFYIRKSRKNDGLQKVIEGSLGDEKIILVDDLINSGKTFMKQLEILEKMGKKVQSIFTLVNFRDLRDYAFLEKKNIKLVSLVALPDLGIPFLGKEKERPPLNNFEAVWYFQSPDPNYFYVVPKS